MLSDEADAPSGDRLGPVGDILPSDRDLAAARRQEPGQHQAELLLAAGTRADDGDVAVEGEARRDVVDDLESAVLAEADIGELHVALERRDLLGLDELRLLVDHAGRGELLNHLLVHDPRVVLALVEGEQLAPGAREILLRADDRDERPDIELSLQDQIAPDREEEERRHLVGRVVDVFDEELEDENPEAGIVLRIEAVGEVGALEAGGVVGVNLERAADRLAEAFGEPALRADARACCAR